MKHTKLPQPLLLLSNTFPSHTHKLLCSSSLSAETQLKWPTIHPPDYLISWSLGNEGLILIPATKTMYILLMVEHPSGYRFPNFTSSSSLAKRFLLKSNRSLLSWCSYSLILIILCFFNPNFNLSSMLANYFWLRIIITTSEACTISINFSLTKVWASWEGSGVCWRVVGGSSAPHFSPYLGPVGQVG